MSNNSLYFSVLTEKECRQFNLRNKNRLKINITQTPDMVYADVLKQKGLILDKSRCIDHRIATYLVYYRLGLLPKEYIIFPDFILTQECFGIYVLSHIHDPDNLIDELFEFFDLQTYKGFNVLEQYCSMLLTNDEEPSKAFQLLFSYLRQFRHEIKDYYPSVNLFLMTEEERFVYEAEKKLSNIKANAKKRGIVCTLELDDIKSLLSKKRCYYTGVRFDKNSNTRKRSIDRIDNSIGYEPGNVVACCVKINTIKNSLLEDESGFTLKQFLSFAEKISKKLG